MKVNPSLGMTGPINAVKGGHRIMLVDDHPMMRNGLSQLIDQEPDLKVCGQFEDAARAFEAIAALQPDLAIVDLSLSKISNSRIPVFWFWCCPCTMNHFTRSGFFTRGRRVIS